jgi:hypothetical protein
MQETDDQSLPRGRQVLIATRGRKVDCLARIDQLCCSISSDFRGLKLTHNGASILDGVPGTRKLQCEVFSLLPLGIA